MRWIKFILPVILLFVVAYVVTLSVDVPGEKTTVSRDIPYPVSKVYNQFANLQNFSSWNSYFADNKKISYNFYEPYSGESSSMSFKDEKNNLKGEIFIRYAKPEKALRYHIFVKNNRDPNILEVVLKPLGESKTSVKWTYTTPKQNIFKRILHFFGGEFSLGDTGKNFNNLVAIMGNKVDRENQLALIKYDSIMVENRPSQILLGVNISANNSKDNLYKNVLMNHNKVLNFVKTDLAKKDDEFGNPVMIYKPEDTKNREISYFYGVPLSKREAVSDNNYTFRTQNVTKTYLIYMKGNFSARSKYIQMLLQKARKDTMRNGDILQEFMEEPQDGKDCILKISLPVYK